MREDVEEGSFFCPQCGTRREFYNVYEVGWSTGNRGYRDRLRSEVCPRCGDNTTYETPKAIRGFNWLLKKCPSCGGRTIKGKFCRQCGGAIQ